MKIRSYWRPSPVTTADRWNLVALLDRPATDTSSPADLGPAPAPPAPSSRVGLVVGALWLAVLIGWPDLPFTITFDDAWYYAQVAANVADGNGSTFDGINTTNGYHPLWLLFSVPFFAFGLSGVAAMRVLLGVQLLGWALVIGLVATIVRVAGIDSIGRLDRAEHRRVTRTATVALAIVGLTPMITKTFANGMESGLVGPIHALLLLTAVGCRGRLIDAPRGTRWILGALFALVVLARTDGTMIVLAAGLWSLPDLWPLSVERIRRALPVFAPSVVALMAFMAGNLALVGHPLQVSGEIKRVALTTPRFALLAVFVLGAGWVLRAGRRASARTPDRFLRTHAIWSRSAFHLAGAVLQVGYYVTLSAQQWLWYFAPLILHAVLLAVAVITDFSEEAEIEGRTATRPTARFVGIALVVGLLAGALFQTSRFTDPNLGSIQLANREAAEWVSANLPDDAVLSAWDAGVLGYFAEQPVVNLDGVINSYEYLDALNQGTTATFLAENDVTWVINHGPMDETGVDPDFIPLIRAYFGVDEAAITLERTWPFTYSGTTDSEPWPDGLRPMAVYLYRIDR
ncbi:MAG: hypothetical protein GY929_07105 [Actinomycetia bacterium]|nr:hypothetical protein [Actinomycetes bacterium]